MVQLVLLVCVALVSTFGVLGAPLLRSRALNVYHSDRTLEIRNYALVRRGRTPMKNEELKHPRRPGFFLQSQMCPLKSPGLPCCMMAGRTTLFTNPGSLNKHCVRYHGSKQPWPPGEQPATVPIPTNSIGGRPRQHPPGETTQSLASAARLAALFPAAAHLLAPQPVPVQTAKSRRKRKGTPADPADLPGRVGTSPAPEPLADKPGKPRLDIDLNQLPTLDARAVLGNSGSTQQRDRPFLSDGKSISDFFPGE
jgi:hypothetical protein